MEEIKIKKIHNWTSEENDFIIQNHNKLSKAELCDIFDVSMSSMMHKFQRLGLTEKSIMGMSYDWSETDIQYLKDNWLYKQDKEIWKDLGIDKKGFGQYVVQRKRKQLGLIGKSKRIRKNKAGYKYHIDYDKIIFTHREKMEEKLGRKLSSTEIVHHIDGDKSNDDINNLYLCKDNSEHKNLHNQIESLGFELYRNGIIHFNQENGQYYL